MRRFAEDTSVPVARSRAAIDALLRDWGCTGLGWSDDFDAQRAALRFRWTHEGVEYLARFVVQLPDDAALKKTMRASYPTRKQLDDYREQRARQAYRVLLLWIKAALNAVDAGLVSAASVFLPWLEGADGRTVAEVALPRLTQLLQGSATRLLTE